MHLFVLAFAVCCAPAFSSTNVKKEQQGESEAANIIENGEKLKAWRTDAEKLLEDNEGIEEEHKVMDHAFDRCGTTSPAACKAGSTHDVRGQVLLQLAKVQGRFHTGDRRRRRRRRRDKNGGGGAAPTPTQAPGSPLPTPAITGPCDESTWPDVDHGLVCGECKVLVDKFNKKYKTCHGYCQAVGRQCTGAWDEDSDTCKEKSGETCDAELATSDAICECGATLTPTPAPAPTPGPYANDKVSAVEYEFFNVLNKFRAEGFKCPGKTFKPNPTPLKFDCRLWKAAQLHSQDMADKDYFSHRSKDGRRFTDRTWAQGIKSTGEICAKGRSIVVGGEVLFRQWQESSGHCKAMGDPDQVLMGPGYGTNPDVSESSYWTVNFRDSRRSIIPPDHSCLPAAPAVGLTESKKDTLLDDVDVGSYEHV
jgi:uncharacterized protein YkwD